MNYEKLLEALNILRADLNKMQEYADTVTKGEKTLPPLPDLNATFIAVKAFAASVNHPFGNVKQPNLSSGQFDRKVLEQLKIGFEQAEATAMKHVPKGKPTSI